MAFLCCYVHLQDGVKSSTGFTQRFSFHFLASKHLSLSELKCIDVDFKNGIVEDVLYPLLRDSTQRKYEVKNYFLKKDTEAYDLFNSFHDDIGLITDRLSTNYVSGYDNLCSYIGKMCGKALREAAVLTELLPRLKRSLEKRKGAVAHSTPFSKIIPNLQNEVSTINSVKSDLHKSDNIVDIVEDTEDEVAIDVHDIDDLDRTTDFNEDTTEFHETFNNVCT